MTDKTKPQLHSHVTVPPEFASLTFQDMVTDVAGRALCELVKGTVWRSIIYNSANEIVGWRMSQPDIKAAQKYLNK
jgi:hypothetical protein